MKTLYHGTIDKFAADILKTGLQPMTTYKWDATTQWSKYNPKKDDEPGFVYLTEWPYHALEYVEAKARYFTTAPGHKFLAINDITLTKGKGAPVIPAVKPALLEINLTEQEEAHLETDWQDSAKAFQYRGIIRPEHIKFADIAKAYSNKDTVIQAQKEFLKKSQGLDDLLNYFASFSKGAK